MPISNGQILNNRYRIDALLGQGGMGAVYRALDLNLGIPVAVKENLDFSPDAQKQFSREAGMLARLSHPNLPRVTDYFFVPRQGQYLVMDFVEGEDLQSMLNQRGVLPETQVLAWIGQICDALAYLHSQPSPIIHRDIKPANIRIRSDGRAMLVDFGIAKIYSEHLATTIGAKAITPGYSPPEQYGGGITDRRSDVYALGATLYHLLTGRMPPESVQRMVGAAPLLNPRQINPRLNPATEQAILKAIEVATDRRFQTVEELRAVLTRPPAGASPSAARFDPRPRAVSSTSTRVVRRAPQSSERRWIGVAVAGLLGMLVLLVGTLAISTATGARQTPTPAIALVPTTQLLPPPSATTPLATAIPARALMPTATPVPVIVPPVVAQSPEDAIRLLQARKLTARLFQEPAAACAGIVTRQEPPMGAEVEAGTAVQIFACIGPTPTAMPTVTPVSPLLTATPSDPTLYDDFNNSFGDGHWSYDRLRWTAWKTSAGHMVGPDTRIEQTNGTLLLTVAPQSGSGGPVLEARSPLLLSGFKFAQAKVMMLSNQTGGGSLFRVQLATSANNKPWWTECDLISDAANARAFSRLIVSRLSGGQYSTRGGAQAQFDTWHLLRLEIDQETMTIRCFLDGNLVDSLVPPDASQVKDQYFRLDLGIWTDANRSATFKVDEVWIGR